MHIEESGRLSDGGVFRNTDFGQQLVSGRHNLPAPAGLPGCSVVLPHVVVGDAAFPLLPNLMRPYPGKHLPLKKAVFNYRLSRARRMIENSFGILASRWRIYRQPICATLPTLKAIVMATVCLHNFLRGCDSAERARNCMYCSVGYVDIEDASGKVTEGKWRRMVTDSDALQDVAWLSSNMYTGTARQTRDTFADYFCSVGEVPWQYGQVYRGRTPEQ